MSMSEEQQEQSGGKDELFPFQDHFISTYWERFTESLLAEVAQKASQTPAPQPVAHKDEASNIDSKHPATEQTKRLEPNESEQEDAVAAEATYPDEQNAPEPKAPKVQLDAMLGPSKPTKKVQPAPGKKGKTATKDTIAERETFMRDFYDFQDVTQGFYEWSIGAGETVPSIWAQLTSLEIEELAFLTRTEDSRLRRILAKNMEVLNDDAGWDEARRIFGENQLELNTLRQTIMVSSVERSLIRISDNFSPEKYIELPSKDKIELLLQAEELGSDVGFKVKFRRDEIGKLDDLILEALQVRRIYEKVNNRDLRLVLVVFTTIADAQLDEYNDLFVNQLEEIEPRSRGSIDFVAVNVLDQSALGDRIRHTLDRQQGEVL